MASCQLEQYRRVCVSKLFDDNGYMKDEHMIKLSGPEPAIFQDLLDMAESRIEVMALEHCLMWTVHDKVLEKLMDMKG